MFSVLGAVYTKNSLPYPNPPTPPPLCSVLRNVRVFVCSMQSSTFLCQNCNFSLAPRPMWCSPLWNINHVGTPLPSDSPHARRGHKFQPPQSEGAGRGPVTCWGPRNTANGAHLHPLGGGDVATVPTIGFIGTVAHWGVGMVGLAVGGGGVGGVCALRCWGGFCLGCGPVDFCFLAPPRGLAPSLESSDDSK